MVRFGVAMFVASSQERLSSPLVACNRCAVAGDMTPVGVIQDNEATPQLDDDAGAIGAGAALAASLQVRSRFLGAGGIVCIGVSSRVLPLADHADIGVKCCHPRANIVVRTNWLHAPVSRTSRTGCIFQGAGRRGINPVLSVIGDIDAVVREIFVLSA